MSADSAGGSRPSKTNCQEGDDPPETADSTDSAGEGGSSDERTNQPDLFSADDLLGEAGNRPVSVQPGRKLRDEVVDQLDDGTVESKPWYVAVNRWRQWMSDYRSMHIEFEKDGETARSRLENSYQPRYGKRYYAKLKDLERGIERTYDSLTTVMLTFSASSENSGGRPRCPADHMRDIAQGWDTARKQLHQALSGRDWEYAKVWEPHQSGYGHQHVAVFVDGEVTAREFQPVMDSYVRNTGPAGRDAHTLGNAVSVNDNVENLGTYISEYIGCFGDSPLDREIHEQMFYAVTWATGTRRVEFSNGAQEIISTQQFVRETGLRPCDRGKASGERSRSDDAESDENLAGVKIDPAAETIEEVSECAEWTAESICVVREGEPEHNDPAGGSPMVEIDGRPWADPPPEIE